MKNLIKDIRNAKWKVRYNNLDKKYQETIKKYEEQLDKDKNIEKIRSLRRYCSMLKRQRDNLREENLRLMSEKKC